jgi:basic amino acid/polyamine antiporter, APA family
VNSPHKHSQLKPTIGSVQLTFYGVGVIVGAGVYSVIGAASAIAHDALWFSFVIGGLVAFLTGLSYAEMTTAFPAAGAEYSYVRRAFPKAEWMSVLVALTILIGASATASTVAVAFGGYLREFVDLPQPVSALLLLVGCTVLNVIGLRESSWANILFTCIEAGGLLLVIAAGLTKGNVEADVSAPLHPGVIEAAAILFFVYLGFEQIANLSEEVRTPARDIPRAIFLSIGVTTVLYVLVALAVLAVARPAELAGSAAPLAVVMQHAWPQAGPLMSGIALFATANTVLITMIASSRLLFSMARDGFIHEVFAALTKERRTPAVAACLSLAAAAVLVPFGSITTLAGISSFAALLAFLAVNVTLVVLRFRAPDHHRPFRVPLSLGRVPLLPLAAIGCIALLLTHFEAGIYFAGAAALITAVVIYGLQMLWRRYAGADRHPHTSPR